MLCNYPHALVPVLVVVGDFTQSSRAGQLYAHLSREMYPHLSREMKHFARAYTASPRQTRAGATLGGWDRVSQPPAHSDTGNFGEGR